MQIQMAVLMMLFAGLFAIPAQALVEDESKKRRAAAKVEKGGVLTTSSAQGVEASGKMYKEQPAASQGKKSPGKPEQDVEFEGTPPDYYKNVDLKSF